MDESLELRFLESDLVLQGRRLFRLFCGRCQRWRGLVSDSSHTIMGSGIIDDQWLEQPGLIRVHQLIESSVA